MRIHYFAAARAAAGTAEEEVGQFATLGLLLDDAALRHPAPAPASSEAAAPAKGLLLADVLERCTFLVDGRRAERETSLAGAERVDVLPPFAGG